MVQFRILFVTLITSLISFISVAQECPRVSGTVRLTATGDILVHKVLFEQAMTSSGRFRILWSNLNPVLRAADLLVGNLEGPAAPGVGPGGVPMPDPGQVYDGNVYSGTKFVFNYHPSLLDDLKSSGFDLLTTSNNHALDRLRLGVDRTIEQIEARGLRFVGTRKSNSQESLGKVIRVGDFRIGVVSCTEHTNGMPDKFGQTLRCDSKNISNLISILRQQSDGVIVFPHWGEEYQTKPSQSQRSKAQAWASAGAFAIVGNHPHVLQTSEWITTADRRETLVVYSLGNFIAAQKGIEKQTSALTHLDLGMSAAGLEVSQYSYTPIERPPGQVALQFLRPSTTRYKYVQSQMGPIRCH